MPAADTPPAPDPRPPALAGLRVFDLSALIRRLRFGGGAAIEVTLAGAMAAFLAPRIATHVLSAGRAGPAEFMAPTGDYRTAEGLLTLAVLAPDDVARLCAAPGRPRPAAPRARARRAQPRAPSRGGDRRGTDRAAGGLTLTPNATPNASTALTATPARPGSRCASAPSARRR